MPFVRTIEVDEPLFNTLADIISLLEERSISYAVVGGIASSMRGEVRATTDVDLVILISVEESLQLMGAGTGTRAQRFLSS